MGPGHARPWRAGEARLPDGGRSAQDDGSEPGRQETQLGTLCAQFDEVEIACRADDGVNLLQRGVNRHAKGTPYWSAPWSAPLGVDRSGDLN